MTKLVNLKNHKSKKKAELIAKDLEQVVHIMSLTLSGLKHYSKYIQVMETMSCLQNNKTLLEIHLSKYKRLIEGDLNEK